MLSCEFIQWEGSWQHEETLFSGEDTMCCPGHSCALFRASSQTKPSWVKKWWRQGACTAVLLLACRLLHLLQRRYMCLFPLCLVHEEWTAIRWVRWWKIVVVCYCGSLGELDALSLFQQRGTGEPQQGALRSSPEEAKQELGQLGPRLTKLASRTARSTKLQQLSQGIAH